MTAELEPVAGRLDCPTVDALTVVAVTLEAAGLELHTVIRLTLAIGRRLADRGLVSRQVGDDPGVSGLVGTVDA